MCLFSVYQRYLTSPHVTGSPQSFPSVLHTGSNQYWEKHEANRHRSSSESEIKSHDLTQSVDIVR